MGPAEQTFDGDDLAGPQIELRLVVQHELMFVDRGTQFFQQQQPVSALVEVRLVDRKRNAAQLGPVHRDIRAPQQAGAVGGISGRKRDADARADAGAHRIQDEGLGQPVRQPLGDRGGVVGVCVHEHHDELVTSQPDKQVGLAQAGRQARAQLLEELVAGGMAEGVVDLLEMVEVDEEEGKGSRLRGRCVVVCEERVKHGGQTPSVAQTGELIGDRLVAAFLAEGPHPAHGQNQPDADKQERGSSQTERNPARRVQVSDEEDDQRARGAEPRNDERAWLLSVSGLDGRGRNQTAIDRNRIDAGQANASRTKPGRPNEEAKRLAVSPTTLTAIPPAMRIHGAFRRPDITVDPPTTRLSSSRSAMGYARLVTAAAEFPPAR